MSRYFAEQATKMETRHGKSKGKIGKFYYEVKNTKVILTGDKGKKKEYKKAKCWV